MCRVCKVLEVLKHRKHFLVYRNLICQKAKTIHNNLEMMMKKNNERECLLIDIISECMCVFVCWNGVYIRLYVRECEETTSQAHTSSTVE